MLRVALIALGLSAWSLPSPAAAQQASRCTGASCLRAGARVRVSTRRPPLDRHVAIVARLSDDSLWLVRDSTPQASGDTSLTLPLAALERLDVSLGRRRASVAAGIGVGLLVGTVAGGVAGYAASGGFDPKPGDEFAGIGLLFGAPIGALLGAIVGGIVQAERGRGHRWQPIRLPIRPVAPAAPPR